MFCILYMYVHLDTHTDISVYELRRIMQVFIPTSSTFVYFFRVMGATCSSIIVWMFKMRFQFSVYEHVIVIVGWKALQHLW